MYDFSLGCLGASQMQHHCSSVMWHNTYVTMVHNWARCWKFVGHCEIVWKSSNYYYWIYVVWSRNKGAYHHLLCVDAARVSQQKHSHYYQPSVLYLPITDNVNVPLLCWLLICSIYIVQLLKNLCLYSQWLLFCSETVGAPNRFKIWILACCFNVYFLTSNNQSNWFAWVISNYLSTFC